MVDDCLGVAALVLVSGSDGGGVGGGGVEWEVGWARGEGGEREVVGFVHDFDAAGVAVDDDFIC